MIYVIADDLTGANDTGVQFTKNGYRTTVFILDENESSSETFSGTKCDVVVMDTETRGVEEKVARNSLNKMLKHLDFSDKDIIYKKIDSTLRGNVGAEIEEIMKIFKKQFCIMSPSFPSQQRVTIGGRLLVQKKPLGISGYVDNSQDNPEDSYIPYLLEKQTDCSIGRIDLLEVCKGQDAIKKVLNDLIKEKKKIIVVDSINEEHLRDIVSSGINFNGRFLFSGSAGLANYLAEGHQKKRNIGFDIKNNKDPILIIGGSRNPIMIEQIDSLKSNLGFGELKIDIEQIYSQKNRILNDYAEECLRILNNNQDLVIYTDAINNEKKLINNKLMKEYNLDYKELENEIKEFFGKLVSIVVKNSNIRNLILTGGDIAISVCKELHISNLQILGELLPGIPLTRASYKNNDLNIVTKAGGFGTSDTLNKLVNKFRHKKKNKRVEGRFTISEPKKS